DWCRPTGMLPQGPAPVTGVFPAGEALRPLETGLQAIQLSPYHADPPARRPVRLGTATGFLACYCPLHLSDPGKPSDPEITPPISARCASDITLRLVAQHVQPWICLSSESGAGISGF